MKRPEDPSNSPPPSEDAFAPTERDPAKSRAEAPVVVGPPSLATAPRRDREVSARNRVNVRDVSEDAEEPRKPSTLRRAERTAKPSMFRRALYVLRTVALFGLALAVGAGIALALYVRKLEGELPEVKELKGNYKPPQVTRILGRDKTILAEVFTERRTVVPIGDLPPHVKLAALAAEDANFYEHEGLNYIGIFRAMLVNLRHGKWKQGGSTITQQVVKNVLLDPEKSFRRKVREALLARRLEQTLSKDEILELYLNHIYFGRGRYGIEEAALDSFGKSAKDLSIAEAALLAGTIACPESCSPRKDPKRALERRAFVLDQMNAKGFFRGAEADFEAARVETVHLAAIAETHDELAPEVVSYVRRLLHDLEPERATRGGFTVETTIDPKLQRVARDAVVTNLVAFDKRRGLTGPLKVPQLLDKRGKAKPLGRWEKPWEGAPQAYRTYVGIVGAADDAAGTFDVQVGNVTGIVKLSDYPRYNPQKLAPSGFAPPGAFVRVSLLAPPASKDGKDAKNDSAPPDGKPGYKVPLRLEIGPEAAFVALDARTRDVLALVGNYEGAPSGLDRVNQAERQPGSTFKPILYGYALKSRRWTPASMVDINPQSFGNYKPSNYEGWTAKDPLRLREVLANSVNVGAVRVMEDVGPANIVSFAQALGIKSKLAPDLSLALGSYEVKPIELAGAYATFATLGTYVEPRFVTRIIGPDGKEVPLPERAAPKRVMDDAEAWLLVDMMKSVVDHGTATRAKSLGRPVAGKTGTSNDSKDTWFAGFSPDFVAVSWVGFDDGRPLGAGEAGGVTALPPWIAFMKGAEEGKPVVDFPKPSGIVTVAVDKKTGLLPFADDPETMDENFLAGTEPKDVAEPVVLDGGAPEEGGLPTLPPPGTVEEALDASVSARPDAGR